MPFAGAVKLDCVPLRLNGMLIKRWSKLVECVTELRRISENRVTSSLPVVTLKPEPNPMLPGASVMLGRAAGVPSLLNRYGGLKISAFLNTGAPLPDPPAEITRPSGKSAATEWYRRGFWALESVLNLPLLGFQSSAASTDWAGLLNPALLVPPVDRKSVV